MQIKLAEVDIRAGIALYLTSRGITGVTAENLQVTFTAGRKGAGLTAEVVTNLDSIVQVTIKDDNGTTRLQGEVASKNVSVKQKSSADLPNALGGNAGESSGVAGADVAAKDLEAKREAADAEPEVQVEAPKAEVQEDKPAVVAEEGKSLFS